MAAGTVSSSQLRHKGLEFIETTTEELMLKREITGLTPRAANSAVITASASCSLQVQMADRGRKAQTCVLYLRTLAPQLAGKNSLVEGDVYVTLRKHFVQGYASRNAMAACLSKTLGDHDESLGARQLLEPDSYWSQAAIGARQLLEPYSYWSQTAIGSRQLLEPYSYWSCKPIGCLYRLAIPTA
jgi:hypothetical protein